jgi:microcystin-dependent protein
MPGLTAISVPNPPNAPSDLPAGNYPATQRIVTSDPVGPSAANRQPRALERRTVTVASLLKQIADQVNLVDQFYLRRDCSAQADDAPNAGLRGHLPMNGNRIVDLGNPVDPGDAVNMDWAVARAGDVMTGALGLPGQTDLTPGDVAARLDYVRNLVASVEARVGQFSVYATVLPPPGFLVCDGTFFSTTGWYRSDSIGLQPYPFTDGVNTITSFAQLEGLRLAYGALWGGDGTTSIQLPDARGRTLIGAGQGNSRSVLSVTLTNLGQNYTTPPTVTFAAPPPGGTTATGTAFVEDGRVVYIRVDNGGSGYTSAPTITLTGGGGTSAAAAPVMTLSLRAVGERGGLEKRQMLASEAPYHTHWSLSRENRFADAWSLSLAADSWAASMSGAGQGSGDEKYNIDNAVGRPTSGRTSGGRGTTGTPAGGPDSGPGNLPFEVMQPWLCGLVCIRY